MNKQEWITHIKEKYPRKFILHYLEKYSDYKIKFNYIEDEYSILSITYTNGKFHFYTNLRRLDFHKQTYKEFDNFEEPVKLLEEIIGEFEFYERRLVKSSSINPVINYVI